ncbi:DUF3316 domain-containing protein [Vibrio tapetis]|uniref:Acyl-CoA synthetase n=1 Tax=Vibrio tapetis subsp. tapetis TaxID=1671868 RepID=A0A2N8ZKZ4_9VIBR|nr:DUF3316 domain-containing protein [Vibrio tapetis]SON52557.1 conserved exported protein of unknown function [Vibrio tapetis subsp. tapetis]
MKKLLIIAATALISSTAFASTNNLNGSTDIATDGYQTKDQAYSAGYSQVESVNKMNSQEQALKLGLVNTEIVYNSVGVDEMEVKVEEYSPERGIIAYRAIVNIDYHYSERDNG